MLRTLHPVGAARRRNHGPIRVPRFSVWGRHGPRARTPATITLVAPLVKSALPCGRTRVGNLLALPPLVRVPRAP